MYEGFLVMFHTLEEKTLLLKRENLQADSQVFEDEIYELVFGLSVW